MKKLIPVLVACLTSACASVPLPQEKRELTFVEQTGVPQKAAYNAALAYLAKNLGDSNFAIKVKDQDAGTIITDFAFECSDMKSFMDLSKHVPVFSLEVGLKDQRARFVFEARGDRVYNIDGSLIVERPFSRESEVQSARSCVEREKAAILKAITSKASANW